MKAGQVIRLLPSTKEGAEIFGQMMFDEWKANHLTWDDLKSIDYLSYAFRMFYEKRYEFLNDPANKGLIIDHDGRNY